MIELYEDGTMEVRGYLESWVGGYEGRLGRVRGDGRGLGWMKQGIRARIRESLAGSPYRGGVDQGSE